MSSDGNVGRPWGLILKAGAKGLAKSLVLSAVLVGPGFLLMEESRILGMIWVMAGSFVMMAWSYRRPWRMMVITCLIPPAASLLAWLVQLAILGGDPPAALLLMAAAFGLAVGFVRGGAHQVYEDEGAVWARRTGGYLLAWLVAYAVTQLFHALGNNKLMEVGRLGGVFTTAMLAAVSLVLLGKYRRVRRSAAPPGASGAARAVLLLVAFAVAAGAALAQEPGAHEIVEQLLRPSEVSIQANRVSTQYGPNGAGFAVRHYVYVKDVMVGNVQRTQRAGVTVNVRRYASNADCMTSGQEAFDMVSSGGNRASNQGITQPTLFSEVQRLGHGDLSFGRRDARQRISMETGYTASVFSGRWLVQVTVGDAPAIMGDYGKLLARERHKVLALQSLNTAYQRLRAMGLGGERDASLVPWIGGGGSSNSVREAAEAAAVIAMILVAAGVAVGVANAIAAAVVDAARRAAEQAGERAAESLPPLIDPNAPGEPLEPDAQGRYWDPRSGRWVDRAEAEIMVAELEAQKAALDHDRRIARGDQALQRERDWDDHRRRARNRDDAERAREAEARAEHEARMREAERPDFLPTGEMLDGTPGWDDSTIGWWVNALGDTVRGAGQEILDLPNQAADAARAVWETVTDPENLTVAGETWQGFSDDLTGALILDSGRVVRVGGHMIDAGVGTANVVATLVSMAWGDPAGAAVGVVKAVTGYENWTKVIEGDRPLLERGVRAIWGAFDTGGVIWSAGAAAKAVGGRVVGGIARATELAGDLGKGLSAADKTADALKGAGAVDQAMDGARVLDGAGDAARTVDGTGDAVRAADGAGEAARTARGARAARTADLGGDAARAGDAADAGRAAGRAEDAASDAARAARGRSPYDMAPDPESYIRDLPDNALVDQNLLDGGGYSGRQMEALRDLSRQENVIIGTRTTNMDSMAKIRDGVGVPKPLTIKSKTIGDLDVYLGASRSDKGLVGYFRPRPPSRSQVPPHLWDQVQKRYTARLSEYSKLQGDMTKLVAEGEVVLREGKIYKVMDDGALKPFAGDIDPVYFKDATTGELLTGDRYVQVRQAFMDSGAMGQHGAESNLIADLLEGKVKGTPEYDAALKKAQQLHASLSEPHMDGTNIILDMGPEGHFRRGARLVDGIPIAEIHRGG